MCTIYKITAFILSNQTMMWKKQRNVAAIG